MMTMKKRRRAMTIVTTRMKIPALPTALAKRREKERESAQTQVTRVMVIAEHINLGHPC